MFVYFGIKIPLPEIFNSDTFLKIGVKWAEVEWFFVCLILREKICFLFGEMILSYEYQVISLYT